MSQTESRPDVRWEGVSGRRYGYWIHPMDATFRKIAGNIILARQDGPERWIPLYVGETRNFDEGFADPGSIDCAARQGATHVHVHFSSPSKNVRTAERDDIVARWRPICNEPE
ncbi:MAG: hypothetical protein K9M82_06620 [Deltaproteobacteria bacterium]|nr:hypothetical protein [Deltaproteobacteria bacterium]